MSDYAKVEITATYSENSSYQPAQARTDFDDYAITPDEFDYRKIEADTGGTTYELGSFASIPLLAIKNTDSTNYVDAAWTDTGANSNTQRIPAGGFLVVSGVDPTADLSLTADSSACICKVFVAGS